MRPCCGHGGIDGFRKNALRFLGNHDGAGTLDANLREKLIYEAWAFIQQTEDIKGTLRESKNYMHDMIKILENMRETCPLLAEYLLEQDAG